MDADSFLRFSTPAMLLPPSYDCWKLFPFSLLSLQIAFHLFSSSQVRLHRMLLFLGLLIFSNHRTDASPRDSYALTQKILVNLLWMLCLLVCR